MTTLTTAIAAVRSRLDEATAVYWSDDEITTWINEGCRDLARRTESLRDTASIAVTMPSAISYNLPDDCIRVTKVQYKRTGDTYQYDLNPTRVSSAEAQSWNNEDSSGTPQLYFTWGFAGTLGTPQLYVRPKASSAGTITVYYYRTPVAVSSGGDSLEIPIGWEDVIYEYCEYKARLKAGDERWRNAKEEYESKLVDFYEVTRDMVDQPTYIGPPIGNNPWWDFGEGWG